MYRSFLREKQVGTVKRQIPIDLVGAYLVVADVAVLPTGVHEHACAYDIGLKKNGRILDASVHMAFRREIDHDVGLLLLKETVDALPITDVQFAESEIGSLHHRR